MIKKSESTSVTRNNALTLEFDKSEIRAFEDNGVLWMAAKDVCDILEHPNVSMFLNMLDPDEKRREILPVLHGRPKQINFINESGLHVAILKSKASKALEFQRWVTRSVLPEISRTGQFKGHAPSGEPMEMAEIMRIISVDQEDGKYIAMKFNGRVEVKKWDNHLFLTSHQRRIFDMMALYFTRAFLNYCDEGVLQYPTSTL